MSRAGRRLHRAPGPAVEVDQFSASSGSASSRQTRAACEGCLISAKWETSWAGTVLRRPSGFRSRQQDVRYLLLSDSGLRLCTKRSGRASAVKTGSVGHCCTDHSDSTEMKTSLAHDNKSIVGHRIAVCAACPEEPSIHILLGPRQFLRRDDRYSAERPDPLSGREPIGPRAIFRHAGSFAEFNYRLDKQVESPVEGKRCPVVAELNRANRQASRPTPSQPEKPMRAEVHETRCSAIEVLVDIQPPGLIRKPRHGRTPRSMYRLGRPVQPPPEGTGPRTHIFLVCQVSFPCGQEAEVYHRSLPAIGVLRFKKIECIDICSAGDKLLCLAVGDAG